MVELEKIETLDEDSRRASGEAATRHCSPSEPLENLLANLVFKYTWAVPKFVTHKIPYLLNDFFYI